MLVGDIMLQAEYEKLPIIEKAETYSQTEDGSIFICSRKGFNEPIYKWKDVYLKFTKNAPETTQELQNTLAVVIKKHRKTTLEKRRIAMSSHTHYGITRLQTPKSMKSSAGE